MHRPPSGCRAMPLSFELIERRKPAKAQTATTNAVRMMKTIDCCPKNVDKKAGIAHHKGAVGAEQAYPSGSIHGEVRIEEVVAIA